MRLLQRPIEHGELTLAVAVDGDLADGRTPPVLLVHGMGSDHGTWRPFASVLRRAGRAVIAVDLRGHGRSGRAVEYTLEAFAADLGFVLDEFDVARADVVGHSLGAHAALRAAMTDPGRVRSLVLEEVPPMPRDQADLDEEIVMSSGFGERVRGIGALMRNPMPVVRFDRAVATQVGTEFERAEPQWWDRLAAVSARTLVISGGPRSFLPPQHLQSLAQALPDGRFDIIDAGHSVHRDRRREFAAKAGAFLAR
ncbi:alpha/beta fold hydrolase [Gordonia sp. L191]|uniref:alpha/beta fold hydrolase n=1 Tax=Gordonia sp. L191 TaxID=2982699 RepID=UPI0024BF4F31|nr:alpha/beta fold hydrolase [Gordonia sp. L191]WHU48286.1 alpha/beta fold hydrolase [Gordonia sp. L191]